METVTRYFRNAIAAENRKIVDFKNEKFITISFQDVEGGFIPPEVFQHLIPDGDEEDEWTKESRSRNILIALKTAATGIQNAEQETVNLEELSGILLIPAVLSSQGWLYKPEEGRMPWIPREFLEPMTEPQLSVGNESDCDRYFEQTIDKKNQVKCWKDYLDYGIGLYEAVTRTSFEDRDIIRDDGSHIHTDGKFYVFLDTTVNSSFHILQLYNHLLKDKMENALYRKLTNGQSGEKRSLYPNEDLNKMVSHCGQMGGEYPLSPSQREALHHYSELEEGEILAVSGPPGTGKTSLIQSMVADMYVNAARKEQMPPIIVAASTNNQAVTNIIDSFGKIKGTGLGNLEERWITGVNSFAVYFPSQNKVKEAKKHHYQFTNSRGEFFFENLEDEENRKRSLERMLSCCRTYFQKDFQSPQECQSSLLEALRKLDSIKVQCINAAVKLKGSIGSSYRQCAQKLYQEIDNLEQKRGELTGRIAVLQNQNRTYLARMGEWRNAYDGLGFLTKTFSFSSYGKKKILQWSFQFMCEEEIGILKRGMSIEEVEERYRSLILENDAEVMQIHDQKLISMEEQLQKERNKMQYLQKQKAECSAVFDKLRQFSILVGNGEEELERLLLELDINRINEKMDTSCRYMEFWLAVHYYEARWLAQKNTITQKQRGKNFERVLDTMYHRLAMVAPCMVMTFFMMPKQFLAYDGNEEKSYYMYNYIDLLIAEEAGQTSPEIGAASFSLAKRAVVVGDEQQIPPVWGTSRALDSAMAVKNGVIGNLREYEHLEENGLNCSQSSIMKLASRSCPFDKYKEGLFLSEHRRCYNEIIQYCNELVYDGNLMPLRGSARSSDNPLAGFLPEMGYCQVFSEKSIRTGCSRKNVAEAQAVVWWLGQNFSQVAERYPSDNQNELMGIITPFRSQANLIRRMLKKELPEIAANVMVGTVHTFQGAERNIIMFSTVYGKNDGCFFLDSNKSLMNVAVSRARDSFLIFGCRECLAGEGKSSSGLLKKMLTVPIS